MTSFRLRWQLAIGHALTALVLMLLATVVLSSRFDDVRRAESTVGAERDAEVLSAQLSPLIVTGRPIDALLASTALRQTEVVGDDAGQRIGELAIGIAPVIVDDELRAVAVVSEAMPPRRG